MTAAMKQERQEEYLTVSLGDQVFAIGVLGVQEVLVSAPAAKVPLAPPEISGVMNLRGRVVTVIDMRRRLGLEPQESAATQMSVVVDHGGELYSLLFDAVGDVVLMSSADFEPNPATLDKAWKDVSNGIYRQGDQLQVILDVAALLDNIGLPQEAQPDA